MRMRSLTPLLLLLVLAIGCGQVAPVDSGDADAVNPRSGGRQVEIRLYFPTTDGSWIETEQRTVIQRGEPLENIILQELLIGPKRPDCRSFFPEGIAVQLDIIEQTAYVSLSENTRDMDHEHTRMQLQALVNSLTEVDGINDVQFLVEGKQQLSINVVYIGEPWMRELTRVASGEYRPIRDVDPRQGEFFIEGEVLKVITGEKMLVIEQHMDSGSVEVEPTILVADDVIIHLQVEGEETREMELADISEGDIIGLVMTPEGSARAIIVHRW